MTTVGSGSREAPRRYDLKTSTWKAGKSGRRQTEKDLRGTPPPLTTLRRIRCFCHFISANATIDCWPESSAATHACNYRSKRRGRFFTDSHKSRDRRCGPRSKRFPPGKRTIKRNVKRLGPWAVDECRLNNNNDRAPRRTAGFDGGIRVGLSARKSPFVLNDDTVQYPVITSGDANDYRRLLSRTLCLNLFLAIPRATKRTV